MVRGGVKIVIMHKNNGGFYNHTYIFPFKQSEQKAIKKEKPKLFLKTSH